VDEDVNDFRDGGYDAVFDVAGDVMAGGHGHVAGDQDVQVALDIQADVAGADAVNVRDMGMGQTDGADPAADLFGGRQIHEFPDGGPDDHQCRLHDKYRYQGRAHMIQKGPGRIENGCGDCGQGRDGAESVGPMVPGIGHHGRAFDAPARIDGPAVKDFLDHNGKSRGGRGNPAWRTRAYFINSLKGPDGVPGDSDAQGEKGRADKQGHGRLDAVMAVLVVAVRGPGPEIGTDDDHQVGNTVGKAVDGVGFDGGAGAQGSGRVFKGAQDKIYNKPDPGDPSDFLLAGCQSRSNIPGIVSR